MKRRFVVGAGAGALALVGLIYLYGGSKVPAGQPPLRRLTTDGVAVLKNEFNAAQGETRVLLLLSPT